jgi:glycopeptide antibiotics resistance protein
MFNSERQKKISYCVFIVYLLLLIWLVLFKFSLNVSELPHIRHINMIPFSESLIINGKLDISEIVYNVLVFVPLGVYTAIFKAKSGFVIKAMPAFFISITFELIQYIFSIGATDITDVIDNTAGGIAGILLYMILKKIFTEKSISIVNIIGILVEISALLMLAILLIANR